MKLSKAKRREIYLKAAENICIGIGDSYVCAQLQELGKLFFMSDVHNHFFEFNLFSPFVDRFGIGAWFFGDDASEERQTALLLCAEMCNP